MAVLPRKLLPRRHVPGDYPKTLCGRLESTVALISHEGEIGYARDICKHCEHLHERADWEKREREREARDSKILDARIDALLSKPCCDGKCGAV